MGLSFAESPINWLTTIHYPWSRCLLVSIPKRMQVSVHDLIIRSLACCSLYSCSYSYNGRVMGRMTPDLRSPDEAITAMYRLSCSVYPGVPST